LFEITVETSAAVQTPRTARSRNPFIDNPFVTTSDTQVIR